MLPNANAIRPKFPARLRRAQARRTDTWPTTNNLRKWEEEDSAIEAEGLAILLEQFNISASDPDCWRSLCLELARLHFPYFSRAEKRPGREEDWDVLGLGRLLRRVADARQEGLDEDAAVEKVQVVHYPRMGTRSLENRLNEAKRNFGLQRILVDTKAVPLVAQPNDYGAMWKAIGVEERSVKTRLVLHPNPDDPDGVIAEFWDEDEDQDQNKDEDQE